MEIGAERLERVCGLDQSRGGTCKPGRRPKGIQTGLEGVFTLEAPFFRGPAEAADVVGCPSGLCDTKTYR